MIYLAVPYTDPDPAVKAYRFDSASRIAARLIDSGKIVISPVTMMHPIESYMKEPKSSDFWCDLDEAFMDLCEEIYVLTLPGWEQSSGVARELVFFRRRKRRITLIGLEDEDTAYSGVGE